MIYQTHLTYFNFSHKKSSCSLSKNGEKNKVKTKKIFGTPFKHKFSQVKQDETPLNYKFSELGQFSSL
jgi:hypothetical protein